MANKPQLSFSCFLALLLPLSDLHGEIPDLIESNALTNQLQTGQNDMPTVLGAVNDSGIFTVTQEEGDKMTFMMMLMMSMEMMLLTQRKYKDIHSRHVEYYCSKRHQRTQTELTAFS